VDFAIEMIDGLPAMAFTPATDIYNNVVLSLSITQGSWFADPAFGMRRRDRLKNTEANARLVEADCRAALQWLLDTGRATRIEVTSERDRSQDLGRLKLLVTVTQADGRLVPFEKFYEVV